MRDISNLDIKIQLTNEYLRTGGVEKIYDEQLLKDLINVKFDENGKARPETITSRVNAFMLAILASHSVPPLLSEEYVSEYHSVIQKSTCFDQTKIDTAKQVDELFEKYKGSSNILFRGQREAKWRLYSTLQRFWIWDKLKQNGKDYLTFLSEIIKAARIKYEKQILEILHEINIDSLNDVAVLGYLQHHNCPTPLLDWTYSFENAMFFGIDGLENSGSVREIDNYFSVYFIEEEHFEGGSMRNLINGSLQELGEELKSGLIAQIAKDDEQRIEMEEHFKERSFFDKARFKGAGLVSHMTKIEHMINLPVSYFSDNDSDTGIAFSITNSQNIKNQQGVFTWNSHPTKPLEVVGNEQYHEAKLESDPDDYRFCECFNIHKSLADYIVQKLAELGITREKIYPDKDIDTNEIYNAAKA